MTRLRPICPVAPQTRIFNGGSSTLQLLTIPYECDRARMFLGCGQLDEAGSASGTRRVEQYPAAGRLRIVPPHRASPRFPAGGRRRSPTMTANASRFRFANFRRLRGPCSPPWPSSSSLSCWSSGNRAGWASAGAPASARCWRSAPVWSSSRHSSGLGDRLERHGRLYRDHHHQPVAR